MMYIHTRIFNGILLFILVALFHTIIGHEYRRAQCIIYSSESRYMDANNVIIPLLLGIQDVSDFCQEIGYCREHRDARL